MRGCHLAHEFHRIHVHTCARGNAGVIVWQTQSMSQVSDVVNHMCDHFQFGESANSKIYC